MARFFLTPTTANGATFTMAEKAGLFGRKGRANRGHGKLTGKPGQKFANQLRHGIKFRPFLQRCCG
jgi:hypothetical protein